VDDGLTLGSRVRCHAAGLERRVRSTRWSDRCLGFVVTRRSVTLRLGRHAVDHLVALGHGEIAYVDGGDNLGADLRRDGYRTAVADHGLHDQIRVALGGYTEGQSASARGDGLSDDFRSWMAT